MNRFHRRFQERQQRRADAALHREDGRRAKRRDQLRRKLNDALERRRRWGHVDMPSQAEDRDSHIIRLIRDLDALGYDMLQIRWLDFQASSLLIRALSTKYVLRDTGEVARRQEKR